MKETARERETKTERDREKKVKSEGIQTEASDLVVLGRKRKKGKKKAHILISQSF